MSVLLLIFSFISDWNTSMSAFKPTQLYGIIGYPLAQTLSPLIHTTSFQHHNISAALVPWQIKPDVLSLAIESIRLLNIQGCCVTIPHKEKVISLLDGITERAKSVGAVNLLYWQNHQLYGDNTDVQGFIDPLLKKNELDINANVLVLGSGGASRAVIVGLKELGFKTIYITNHHSQSAIKLADEFGLRFVEWHVRDTVNANIIINTTPLGMLGKFEDETPFPESGFKGKGIAYDIVYIPQKTQFLREAEQNGWEIISGVDMFIGQANKQHKIWTGHDLSEMAIQSVLNALRYNAK